MCAAVVVAWVARLQRPGRACCSSCSALSYVCMYMVEQLLTSLARTDVPCTCCTCVPCRRGDWTYWPFGCERDGDGVGEVGMTTMGFSMTMASPPSLCFSGFVLFCFVSGWFVCLFVSSSLLRLFVYSSVWCRCEYRGACVVPCRVVVYSTSNVDRIKGRWMDRCWACVRRKGVCVCVCV
jgi:hypothetical protein